MFEMICVSYDIYNINNQMEVLANWHTISIVGICTVYSLIKHVIHIVINTQDLSIIMFNI